jgi:3-methyladenine DNA glycosylase AlkD
MESRMKDPVEKLKQLGDPKRAKQSQGYFKTGPGEYAEGDKFLGNNAAQIRNLAKQHQQDAFSAIRRYIRCEFHEVRLFGLLCLVYRFEKADPQQRQKIYQLYVSSFRYINNWDLVDCSAPHVVGLYLLDKDRTELYHWAHAKSMWSRRIAMLACFSFIRQRDYADALAIADILLQDEQDLIHKAVGWMLREIGKRDLSQLQQFLKPRYSRMPRTMLRYAIEKLEQKQRQAYLKGHI